MKNLLPNILIKCLVNQLYALECADEALVDSDFLVKIMESVGAEFQMLQREDVGYVKSILSELYLEEDDVRKKEYISNFIEYFGIS